MNIKNKSILFKISLSVILMIVLAVTVLIKTDFGVQQVGVFGYSARYEYNDLIKKRLRTHQPPWPPIMGAFTFPAFVI